MTPLATFTLAVNYTQVAIFRPDAAEFFELWTEADVERGYLIRDGHIVFGVADHDGACAVTVWLAAPEKRPPDAGLPLQIGDDGVLIQTVLDVDREAIRVPAGRYRVWFAAEPREPEGLSFRFIL